MKCRFRAALVQILLLLFSLFSSLHTISASALINKSVGALINESVGALFNKFRSYRLRLNNKSVGVLITGV